MDAEFIRELANRVRPWHRVGTTCCSLLLKDPYLRDSYDTLFGPRDEAPASPVTGVAGLAGNADVVEVIVRDDAPIAGKPLQEANEEGLIPSDVLIVRINRDEGTLTPTGKTLVEGSDFVTIHSRSGITEETLQVFTGD